MNHYISQQYCDLLAVGEAVFARCLSSLKSERVQASKVLPGPSSSKWEGDRATLVELIRKVCSTLTSFYYYLCSF